MKFLAFALGGDVWSIPRLKRIAVIVLGRKFAAFSKKGVTHLLGSLPSLKHINFFQIYESA